MAPCSWTKKSPTLRIGRERTSGMQTKARSSRLRMGILDPARLLFRVDDQVFLIFGSLVPPILRSTVNIPPLPSVLNGTATSPSGPCCSLVGYAYVHGITDGEAAPTRNQVSAGELEKKQRWRKSLHAVGLALARLWSKKKRGAHQIYPV